MDKNTRAVRIVRTARAVRVVNTVGIVCFSLKYVLIVSVESVCLFHLGVIVTDLHMAYLTTSGLGQ